MTTKDHPYQHIAFGSGKKVELFCEVNNQDALGNIEFFVVNGAWVGTYNIWTGKLFSHRYPEDIRPAKVLWRGNYVREYDPADDGRYFRDYQIAMDWVQRRINHPWMSRWEMILKFISEWHRYRLVVRVVKKETPRQVRTSFFGENDLEDEVPF